MGIDKIDSVVNNLYVSGSSNFATGGYTNPTFTIIQLAIRLAEEINKRLYSLTFSSIQNKAGRTQFILQCAYY